MELITAIMAQFEIKKLSTPGKIYSRVHSVCGVTWMMKCLGISWMRNVFMGLGSRTYQSTECPF